MTVMTDLSTDALRARIVHHMTFTLGRTTEGARAQDWRLAAAHAVRDLVVEPWLTADRRRRAEGGKRVHYLSLEFLIGRILEDATVNLGLRDTVGAALAAEGVALADVVEAEPDAALGNGGLGRLAACFMESMATLGCPAMGHGLRYEHGLFRQGFDDGRQVEQAEDWLTRPNPWEFARPGEEVVVGFGGHLEGMGDDAVWHPAETVRARPHDTPVVGWRGAWANPLRLWAARPMAPFDLDRFNAGDHAGAATSDTSARMLCRVLYPEDVTEDGRALRLRQEYLLVSAALQDILRTHLREGGAPEDLPDAASIQMNDTHPALAGPELIRLLTTEHAMGFDAALAVARGCLNYTNHTLLPEALETWSTWLMGRVLPHHMAIIERIDAHHLATPGVTPDMAIVRDDAVRMGPLAFVMSSHVNGVSALHTDLMRETVFADLDAAYPGRILNQTNGITPRRWLRLANPALSTVLDRTIGAGWTADLAKLADLSAHADDTGVIDAMRVAKRANKVALARWASGELDVTLDPDAMFDVQIKRIHEYKRQLMNVYETVARWHAIREAPERDWTPRVKIFAGKAAPTYHTARAIVRLVNDVARTVNADPAMRGRLKVIFPPNYDVSMAQRLIPAADLSEQISTAGKEASGTGNMKFALNGALTVGTLDGANVEIRERVGPENFFLFGLDAAEARARMATPGHAAAAIAASDMLGDVLDLIAGGAISPEEPDRHRGLVDGTRQHDPFLVASDFDAYRAAQAQADRAYADPHRWHRMALRNVAGSGHFSSDRTIAGYMTDIWGARSLL